MARASRKDEETKARKPAKKAERGKATGSCLCGAVTLEIDTPVFWAWHDHSASSRKAHGAVYATYVGTYRSKARIAKGEAKVSRFVESVSGNVRSFCSACGSPLMYERKQSPKWVNLPRALFAERTGREPRYHIAIDQLQDWIYTGASLAPQGISGRDVGAAEEETQRRCAAVRSGLLNAAHCGVASRELVAPPCRNCVELSPHERVSMKDSTGFRAQVSACSDLSARKHRDFGHRVRKWRGGHDSFVSVEPGTVFFAHRSGCIGTGGAAIVASQSGIPS